MGNETSPARTRVDIRRYPVVGGAAAWCLPLLAVLLAAAGAYRGIDVAAGVAAVGWVAHRLSRSVVVETSPIGLTRGLLALGTFRTRATIIPWRTIVEVHTAWSRPGDDSALETAVRDREGRTIRLSTTMGLAAYWACLAEIARRAPAAARVGITDGVLADGPPERHDLVAAIRAAAALALVLVALAAVHYLWAQGRSSLARDLERASAVGEPRE
jgi:hypothetical protein